MLEEKWEEKEIEKEKEQIYTLEMQYNGSAFDWAFRHEHAQHFFLIS